MKKLIILAVVPLMILGVLSCEKTVTVDDLKLTINSPSQGTSLNNGDSLNINVRFSDPIELHTYSVMILNETDSNSMVLYLNGHLHSNSLTIDTTLALNVTNHSNFKLNATISNYSGDTKNEQVDFHIMP